MGDSGSGFSIFFFFWFSIFSTVKQTFLLNSVMNLGLYSVN